MIEDMEAELTEASKIESITDTLVGAKEKAITEETNVDEDIPIYFQK